MSPDETVDRGLVIAWIVAILSVFMGYWLAAKTGLELVSVAGLSFAAYFAFVGIVAVIMKWNGGCFVGFLTGSSVVICVGFLALDNACSVYHWSVPLIRLAC